MPTPHSSEPDRIEDPEYWKERLKTALRKNSMHQAIYLCSDSEWSKIEEAHRKILHRTILPNESVLDVGCGWGRLLNLLPKAWAGDYLGIDLSPDFIEIAKESHKGRSFIMGKAEEILPVVAKSPEDFIGPEKKFDWCVLVSIREMIVNNHGEAAWERLEQLIRGVANRILFLEYREDDQGSVEYTT